MLRGEPPLPAETSVNAVDSMPEGFRDWMEANADRIKRGQQRGSLPYFVRDNIEKRKSEGTSDSDNDSAEQSFSDEFRISFLGRNNRPSADSASLAGPFSEIQTHDELSTALQDKMRVNLGYDVEVVANKTLIDLDTAKAYAAELDKLTREYELKQGDLGKINLGYNPTASNEYGSTVYTPLTNKKVVSLKAGYGSRQSEYAIECSRCDDHLSPISTATHEFGHLLFQFTHISQIELLTFEQDIKNIYDQYNHEFNLAKQKKDDMVTAAKIHIGLRGHSDIREFLAEAFQEYRNCKSPSKYAVKVGKLIDTWFKRQS